MKIRRSVGLSLRALFAHKLRAMLALSSVAIGVAALVLTSAIGAGAQKEVSRSLENMGTNLLVVRPARVKKLTARKSIRGAVTTLRVEDYEALRELDPVATAAPTAERAMRVKAGTAVVTTNVVGTTADFPIVRRLSVGAGSFFDDDPSVPRVAVLGTRVSQALFAGEEAVGREIRIGTVPFEVIGVLREKGVLADGTDEDNQILVPIRTVLRRVLNTRWLSGVFVSVRDPRRMQDAEVEIGKVLRARHRTGTAERADDFEIQNTAKTIAAQKRAVDSFELLTGWLTTIALVVGGSGILALMFLSVRERTSEIGLRVAVGARPRDIVLQFLLEATFLALGGWLIGLVVGGVGVGLVMLGTKWTVGVPVVALLTSLAMVLFIGIGFGAFPARRASLVPPIEALLTK
jgi:putative ABC transport system permease protein